MMSSMMTEGSRGSKVEPRIHFGSGSGRSLSVPNGLGAELEGAEFAPEILDDKGCGPTEAWRAQNFCPLNSGPFCVSDTCTIKPHDSLPIILTLHTT